MVVCGNLCPYLCGTAQVCGLFTSLSVRLIYMCIHMLVYRNGLLAGTLDVNGEEVEDREVSFGE